MKNLIFLLCLIMFCQLAKAQEGKPQSGINSLVQTKTEKMQTQNDKSKDVQEGAAPTKVKEAQETKSDKNTKTKDEIFKEEIVSTKNPLKIRALPYITLINAENMSSYKWWTAKSKKVPEIYKDVLKKIVEELQKDNIFLGFNFVTVKEFTADTVDQLMQNNTQYLISGNMIYDAEKPEEFILKDIKVNSLAEPSDIFIPESDKDIVNIEQVEHLGQRMKAFFRKDKVLFVPEEPQLFVQFKTSLTYHEIEKIMDQIKEAFKEIKGFRIYSFSGDEVTFSVRPATMSILKEISRLHFLKGPYKKEMVEETLILTPMTEEDFAKPNSSPAPSSSY